MNITLRYIITVILLLLFAGFSLELGHDLSLKEQWNLLLTANAHSFNEYQFYYSSLPRVVITCLVGCAMGLVGSVCQQMTQNKLSASPSGNQSGRLGYPPPLLGTSLEFWGQKLKLAVARIAYHSKVAAVTTT